MSFDIDRWTQATAGKLRGIGRWLDRRKYREVPYLIYGTLCGLSLWPLVERAQAGDTLPVMMALGSVTGGIGANLIANQIQHWADRAGKVTEEEIVEWVAEHAPEDVELRGALDEILERVDAVRVAQERMDEDERQLFLSALHNELQKLGNLSRFEAVLEGSGAIAQGSGAKAAGERGVLIEGDARGNVIVTGDDNRVVRAGTYVEQQVREESPGPDAAALRSSYLNCLFETARRLSLEGIDPQAASDSQARLNLDAVYTALLTMTPEIQDRVEKHEVRDPDVRKLSALEQLNRHPRLVLLGDPGSGKSTFVNFVAMCLAGEALGNKHAGLALLTAPLPDEEGNDRKERQPWDHRTLLPVRVILRDFAARGLPPVGQEARARHLFDFIVNELECTGLGDYEPHLRREMMEQGALLLLDGLDEVPEAERRREQIKQAVDDFARVFPKCRVLVTSRTYAYQRQDWRLPDFSEALLAPFSAGQIRRFVDRWYAHIAGPRGMHLDDARGRAEQLRRAIFNSDRLQGLAEHPLLLTLMASLHAWRGGSLPEKREQLYADTVELLLDWWEGPKSVRDGSGEVVLQQPSLAEYLRVDRERVRDLLDELAFRAHSAQPELVGTADVDEGSLVSGLMSLSQNPDVNPAQLLVYLSHRAGLLVPRGVKVYTFPHRTFQEYLAACYLTDHDYPDLVAKLAREEPNRWREVALLAGAKAAGGSAFAIWALAETLCYRGAEDAEAGTHDVWGAHLAGQALMETADLAKISERDEPKRERVRHWLVHVIRGRGDLPAVERAGAGRSLAKLGDPRPEVVMLERMEFCFVPRGPFVMGSENDPLARDSESPQHTRDIPYNYWLSKYPVTNVQFLPFVESQDGYRNDHWWTAAGLEWRGDRTGPRDHGEPWTQPNHPVVDVCWYEAVAFTRWLAGRWRMRRLLPEGWAVRLPSEAEWEKSARGGMEIPAEPIIAGPHAGMDGPAALSLRNNSLPKRRYPWGEEPDPECANYSDTGIGVTSAVGCFRGGTDPYGCEDMSGNVWEWCATKWQGNYSDYRDDNDPQGGDSRVVRGGSFYYNERLVRCADRFRFNPDNFNYNSGFRVVVAPIL